VLAMVMKPLPQSMNCDGVTSPSSSPAEAVTILNVEPGS